MFEEQLRWVERDYVSIIFWIDDREAQFLFDRKTIDFSDDGDCALLVTNAMPISVAWLKKKKQLFKPIGLLPFDVGRLRALARATTVEIVSQT